MNWCLVELKEEPFEVTIHKYYKEDCVVAINSEISSECMRIAKTSNVGDILYLSLAQKNPIHNIVNTK